MLDRRTFVKAAAWSAPVIAAAVALPHAAASAAPRRPIHCTRLTKKGQPWWQITYDDGTTETLHNGDAMRRKDLKELCK